LFFLLWVHPDRNIMAGIVVIGASQGGVHALCRLIGGLPSDFQVPVAAVIHIGTSQSMLPSIINDRGGLKAVHARDGDKLKPGFVYIAPPDRHVLVVDGELELTRGPRENWARPAVDPLFRSAAEAYGPRAIGVVLTGGLNDGAAGLYEIKRRGGIAIVQDPSDAEAPSMPQSALQNVKADYVLPIDDIPNLLVRLAARVEISEPVMSGTPAMDQNHTAMQPIAQTCPECGGAMRQETLGVLTRFRCHIGHVMTGEILAASQLETLQQELEAVLRSLNERAHLCRDLSRNHASAGRGGLAELWQQAAKEAEAREKAVRSLSESEWTHPEEIISNSQKLLPKA
jgi:two-component system chemotaxis response regulator CheB